MNRREFLTAGGAFAGAAMACGARAATGGADKLANRKMSGTDIS